MLLLRGLPTGTNLSSHAQNSTDSGVLTVNFLGRILLEQREEVQIPRIDFHVITNTDFVNAATQPSCLFLGSPCTGGVMHIKHLTKTHSQSSGLRRLVLTAQKCRSQEHKSHILVCLDDLICLEGQSCFFASYNNGNQLPSHIQICTLKVRCHWLSMCFSYFKFIWFLSRQGGH